MLISDVMVGALGGAGALKEILCLSLSCTVGKHPLPPSSPDNQAKKAKVEDLDMIPLIPALARARFS